MRRPGRAGIMVALALSLGACHSRREPGAFEHDRGARLHVYLDALPSDERALRVSLGAAAAIPEAGDPVPLRLLLRSLGGEATRSQRLLGLAPLPPGAYRGLSVSVAEARVSGGQGTGALQVPDGPVEIAFPFAVDAESATTLILRLQTAESLPGGFRFEPVFTVKVPGTLASGLTAVATVADAGVLVVFHKLSGEVFSVLRTGPEPAGVGVDVERQRAYVASTAGDAVEVFDLVQRVRDRSFPLLAGDRPAGLVVSSDGRTIVTANEGSGTLTVIDALGLAERHRVGVGLEPHAVVLSPDDRQAFALNRRSATISVVDLQSGTVRATLGTDPEPEFAALDRARTRLLVVHGGSAYLVAIRLDDLTVERRVNVGPGAVAIAVDPRTNRVYLARRGTGSIEIFDPASLLPINVIPTGEDVRFLAVDPEGDRLYAAMADSDEARSFALTRAQLTSTTELGAEPVWIAVAGGS